MVDRAALGPVPRFLLEDEKHFKRIVAALGFLTSTRRPERKEALARAFGHVPDSLQGKLASGPVACSLDEGLLVQLLDNVIVPYPLGLVLRLVHADRRLRICSAAPGSSEVVAHFAPETAELQSCEASFLVGQLTGGPESLAGLKAALRIMLPDVKSGHLDEAIARGLGQSSHAALKAAIKDRAFLGWNHPTHARGYLRDLGYEISAGSPVMDSACFVMAPRFFPYPGLIHKLSRAASYAIHRQPVRRLGDPPEHLLPPCSFKMSREQLGAHGCHIADVLATWPRDKVFRLSDLLAVTAMAHPQHAYNALNRATSAGHADERFCLEVVARYVKEQGMSEREAGQIFGLRGPVVRFIMERTERMGRGWFDAAG